MGKEIAEVKKALRAQLREALAELSEEERAESDRILLERFLAHPKLALAQGKTVCLPRCLPGHKLQAHRITGEADLVPDRYQIPAPRPDAPEVAREDIDLILVPGLCFDSRGTRLGQGGGYYDRYLEDYEGATIGLCREDFFQISLPREPLDVWVQTVLTEEGQVWPYREET